MQSEPLLVVILKIFFYTLYVYFTQLGSKKRDCP